MVEQFSDFLSEELLDFCSYGTHENIYMGASGIYDDLDMLTNQSSKEINEYFSQYSEDYCSTNKPTNTKCMSKILGKNSSKTNALAQMSNKSTRNFAMPRTDNEVTETWKTGVPLKM